MKVGVAVKNSSPFSPSPICPLPSREREKRKRDEEGSPSREREKRKRDEEGSPSRGEGENAKSKTCLPIIK
ncbi:MAG: hypothetical protein ACOX1Z_03910 [Candidatus Ratteibacteria bacterium]